MALPNIIQQINSKVPITGNCKITGGNFIIEGGYNNLQLKTSSNNTYTDIAFLHTDNIRKGYIRSAVGNYSQELSVQVVDVVDGSTKYYSSLILGYNKETNKSYARIGDADIITSAGGTMKNTITCSSSYTVAIQKENATSMLTLRSSNDWNGGCIHLWGGNNSGNYPGEVEIIPRTIDGDGNSEYTVFRFRKDGSIERGSTPIHFVVTSWSSGANWYRIWSNGRIEQGGSIPSGGASGWRTLTFPKAFSNTNYSIVVSCSDVNDISYWASSWTKTASTVKVGTGNYIGTKSFIGVDWYASGY